MPLDLKHQTKVQYLQRLRREYRDAVKLEACRLAHKILKHLSDGDVTQAEMQTAWGMTAGQWAAKAATLQPRANKWTTSRSANQAADNEGPD